MTEIERYGALLDERSAALAARGRTGSRESLRRDFLVCAVGAERVGFPLEMTAGVLPERACTPVPGTPPALRGIVADAGIIVGVVDLAQALGMSRDAEPTESGHFLRLRADDPPMALAVDRVVGVIAVATDAIEAAPSVDARSGLGADAVSGYAPPGAGTSGFAIIDLPRLLHPFLP